MGKQKQSAGAEAAARVPLTRRQKKHARRHAHPAGASLPPYGTITAASTSASPAESSRATSGRVKSTRAKSAPAAPEAAKPEAAKPASTARPRRRAATAPATTPSPETEVNAATDTARKVTMLKPVPTTEHADHTEKRPAARRARPVAVADDTRRYPTLARMAAITTTRSPATGSAVAAPQPVELDPPLAANEAERGDAETAPVQVAPPPARKPVTTRRLADVVNRPATAPAQHSGQPEQPEQPAKPRGVGKAARRIRPLLPVEPLPIVAVIHSAVSTVAAISGVTLLLLGTSDSLWPLSLAAITGLSGWIAYLLIQRKRTSVLAGYLLVMGQIGLVAWLTALVGPRVSIVVVMIPLGVLAMRMAGWSAAVLEIVSAMVIFIAGSILWLNGPLAPRITLQTLDAAIVDGVFLCLALLGGLAAVRWLATGRARAEYAARARLHEARQLRAQLTQLRQQVEEDADRLDTVLSDALRGTAPDRVAARSMLSPLGETVNAAMERLATLQRDREERIHLEGAIRVVTRAVERAWLGLPWTWPDWSGTPLDELVALLRAPRPSDIQTLWAEDTPTLVQIPTPDPSVITPIIRDRGTPSSAPSNPSGDLAWLDAAHQRATEDERAQSYPREQPAARRLPWDTWNRWREWDDARER